MAKTQQNRGFAKVGKKTAFTYYRKATKVKLKTEIMALKGQKTTSDFLEWDKMQSIVLKLEREGDVKFPLAGAGIR